MNDCQIKIGRPSGRRAIDDLDLAGVCPAVAAFYAYGSPGQYVISAPVPPVQAW
jgi:hypothetical protein